MKRTWLAGATFVVLLVSSNAHANHSWNGFHWARSSNPITLPVVDSVVGVWDSLLPAVRTDWAASSVINFTSQSGGTSLLGRLQCGAQAGKIRVCSASYGPTLWFGIATVSLNGSHITSATVKVNDYYFTGTYGNNIARRHVLCQELGHDIGLDHIHNAPTCMEDNNSTLNTPSYQYPNAHDYAQLESIYAHLDGSGAKPAGIGSTAPDFVERTVDGYNLTFVYWVNEA